jgi:hypothetical protein
MTEAQADGRRVRLKVADAKVIFAPHLSGSNPKFSANRIEINQETARFFRARSPLKIRERPEGTRFR